METNIQFAKYSETLDKLKTKTYDLINRTGNVSLLQSLKDELDTASQIKKLRIAFVGQYSSGKSTIISALTGNKEINIDANVATDTVSTYSWNNILLLDTPGILAGKVEAHDERTKQALKECDLIFYVLTSQLFDDVIFNNFIDLAYNQHLADKIFIVVNKMGMEDGQFSQLEKNYLDSLSKVFSERGYNLHSFPIAFIDANDYIEGIETKDDDFVEISHFIPFVNQLNAFVDKNGMLRKQFDTPVRILQSYLKNIALSEIDEQLMEFYKQFEQKLSQSLRDIKRDVAEVLASFDSTAMSEVISLASLIGSGDQIIWEDKQKNLDNTLTRLIEDTSNTIGNTIQNNYNELIEDLGEFGQKDSIIKYEESINSRINSPTISIQEQSNLKKQKAALDMLRNAGARIGEFAPGVSNFFSGISQASGSQLHTMVKNIGHFFGKSFKPWEAVRWASNIAKIAKFGIPVVTAGIDIWIQHREDRKEGERLQQIKDSKNLFVTGYQSAINQVVAEFQKYLQEVIDNYSQKRNEINETKRGLITTSQNNKNLQKSIDLLDAEYVDFIKVLSE